MTQAASGIFNPSSTDPGPLSPPAIVAAAQSFQSLFEQSQPTIDPVAPDLRVVGNNRQQLPREDDLRKRSPRLDPTAAAVAELASPGAAKPVIAQAQDIEAGRSDAPGKSSLSEPPAGSRTAPHPRAESPSAPARSVPASKAAPADRTMDTARAPLQPPTGPAATKLMQRQAARPSDRPGPVRTAGTQSAGADSAKVRTVIQAPTRAAGAPIGAAVRITAAPRIAAVPARTTPAKAPSKPTEGPARAAARQEALAAQFGRGLAAALRQNGGTVTMRLQPEALGDLKIKMSLEPGKVEASFEVQTGQARDLLGKTMDKLRSALEAQGLEVARLDVRVAEPTLQGGQHFGGADADSGASGGRGSEHPGPERDAARTPRETLAAEPAATERPGTGQDAGGALRVRLDALA